MEGGGVERRCQQIGLRMLASQNRKNGKRDFLFPSRRRRTTRSISLSYFFSTSRRFRSIFVCACFSYENRIFFIFFLFLGKPPAPYYYDIHTTVYTRNETVPLPRRAARGWKSSSWSTSHPRKPICKIKWIRRGPGLARPPACRSFIPRAACL